VVPLSTGFGVLVLFGSIIGLNGVVTVVFSSVMLLKVVVSFSKLTLITLVSVVAFARLALTCTVMLSCSVCPGVRFPRLQVLFSIVAGGWLVTKVTFTGKISTTVMFVALPSPVLLMRMA